MLEEPQQLNLNLLLIYKAKAKKTMLHWQGVNKQMPETALRTRYRPKQT